MKRNYYKEGDTEYGHPRTRITKRPEGFSLCDTSGWDARRFLRELAIRQGRHEWTRQQDEWALPQYKPVKEGDTWRIEQDGVEPMFGPDATPLTDPDEINKFLIRPPAVSQIKSQEDAAHALALGMALIAVDPHSPDLEERLRAEAKDIRAKDPLPIKDRWRPSASTDVTGIDDKKVEQWRDHRIVDLYDLIKGHDPDKERLQLAWWLFQEDFPNVEDRRARGKKFDRAVELLSEALASMRMIDAQTRKDPQHPEGPMDNVAGVVKKQPDALDERKITVVPVEIKDAVPIADEKVPLRSRT